MNNIMTVYIINRPGIENKSMQDLVELFSGTILASGTPAKIENIITKRGYIVVAAPEKGHVFKND